MPVPLSDRIVEVRTDLGDGARPRFRYGSGCIVGGRTVLTSAHVVVGARAVWVRSIDKVEWDAQVQWGFVGREDGADFALLEIADSMVDLAPIKLAAVDRNASSPVEACHAVGYPRFMERQQTRRIADSWGFIPPLSGLTEGLLTLSTRNSPQAERTPLNETQWSGMSGAPVFVEGCLLGVVSSHTPRQGASEVTVVPLTALEPDPAFPQWGRGVGNLDQWWERLGVSGRTDLSEFPARQVQPEPAYMNQIRHIRGRTPILRNREEELEQIAAFALSSEGYRRLVAGPMAGKTALLAKAVVAAMPPSVDAVSYFLSRARRRRRPERTNREDFLAAVVPQLAYLLGEQSPPSDLHHFEALWKRAADRAVETGRHLLLVVEGIDADRHLRGLPSVASLLPDTIGPSAHVLLTSRANLALPSDVPASHPVRSARLVILPPFPGIAGKARRLAGKLPYAALIVAALYFCAADIAAGGTVAATGDITLVEQHNGQPALVYALASGGMGYLTRRDDVWSQPWAAKFDAPDQPVIGQSTTFASGYDGLEVLGDEGGKLTFAWRANYLKRFHWFGPVTVKVNNQPVTGIRGRPGFLEYPAVTPRVSMPVQQFFAIVPQGTGGVGLYARDEPGPVDWAGYGVIGRQLGIVDSATAAVTGDGWIDAILRSGTRLYEISHAPGPLPKGRFGTGWSAPSEIRTAGNGAVSATGAPELINALAPTQTQMELAVPVHNGVELLTLQAGTRDRWKVARLPVRGQVSSVSVLSGEAGSRRNIDVAYRIGPFLFSTWRWASGQWSRPAIIRWGTPS